MSRRTRFHNYGDVFRDGDRCLISEIRRHILATETQRHREEHNSGSALDAAPRSGGRGASVSPCLRVSVACPNQYVAVITKCCTWLVTKIRIADGSSLGG